ncbi:putative inner membrane protein [compost metagenome]
MRWILPFGLGVALLVLLQHFLLPLLWGGVLAVATWPLVQKLQRRGWSDAASVGAVAAALVVGFGLPLLAIISALKPEVAAVSAYLHQLNATGLPAPEWLHALPWFAEDAVRWWDETLSHPGAVMALLAQLPGESVTQLTGRLGGLGATFAVNALYIFLALLTFVVLSLNAPAVVRHLDAAGRQLCPRAYEVLRALVPLSIRGTALGLSSVAVLEGVLLGVAYAVAGAPMPVLLGVMTGYLALIPGGAPLSFISVSLLLLAQGSPAAAAGLAAWGTVELFLVDKFVRPRIIGASVHLPFLAVLFGLLGGVSTMGVIGLFVGPLLVALAFHYLRAAAAGEKKNGPEAD